MSIIKNRKKSVTAALGVAAATMAAPAMLFLGSGTAHAGGWVWNNADYLGTTVFVQGDGTTFGNCTYNAFPVHGFGIPPGPRHFHLPSDGVAAQLWFPGIKLNETWDVNVTCDHGPAINAVTVY